MKFIYFFAIILIAVVLFVNGCNRQDYKNLNKVTTTTEKTTISDENINNLIDNEVDAITADVTEVDSLEEDLEIPEYDFSIVDLSNL